MTLCPRAPGCLPPRMDVTKIPSTVRDHTVKDLLGQSVVEHNSNLFPLTCHTVQAARSVLQRPHFSSRRSLQGSYWTASTTTIPSQVSRAPLSLVHPLTEADFESSRTSNPHGPETADPLPFYARKRFSITTTTRSAEPTLFTSTTTPTILMQPAITDVPHD
jgi:hypothetical protein